MLSKYQNCIQPTPTPCSGCDGQIAFCCRTNSLLLLQKLIVLCSSPYLSSRSRTNSQLQRRTTNCPLALDFWIVRSVRTFSVYPAILGLKMHRKKGAGCSFDLYINSCPKERSINSAVNVKGLQARILAIE
jgi:hypothetical protein